MKKVKFLLVLGLVFLLVACSNKVVNSGTVISKDHYNAYTTFINVGKVMVPIHHPERWTITVQSCDAKEPNETECPSSSHNVTKQTWDEYELGEYISLQ